MDTYDMIKRSIEVNLTKENIQKSENIISVYDLYEILDKKFEKLRSIMLSKTLFTSKELFGIKSYYDTRIYRSENTLTILVFKNKHYDSGFYINKDLGSDKIYLDGYRAKTIKFMNSFIKKYYDDIVEIFQILEDNHPLVCQNLNSEYASSDFKFDIVIDRNGTVDLNVSVNTNVDLADYVSRKYINEESLDVKLNSSKYELAMKTPVRVDTLKEPLKEIVNEDFEEKKIKVKIIEGIAIG